MSYIKLLQPWACVVVRLLDYLSLCQMEIVMNFSRIYTQSMILKVSFCRSEFGLSGLKMTDFGRNGKGLDLVLVNFLTFLS